MNVGMVKDADLELSLRQAINLEWSQLSDAEQSVYRPKQSGCGFMTTGFSDGSFEFIAQVNLEQLRDCAFISPGLLPASGVLYFFIQVRPNACPPHPPWNFTFPDFGELPQSMLFQQILLPLLTQAGYDTADESFDDDGPQTKAGSHSST